jgi:ribA/ribD-fused uncharacterized protein
MNEEYLFFWNEAPFSQWSEAEFVVDDVKYNCTEQYMMAQKAILFGDEDKLAAIMEATHPRDQKKLGRMVRNFDATRWNGAARDIVYEGNHAKFTQNPEMKEQLFATYPKILVEASPYDAIWGIAMSESEARKTPPDQWRGSNWLGIELTSLRDDLMTEESLL